MSLVDLQYDPPQGWSNNSLIPSIAVPANLLGMWEGPTMVLPQKGNRVILVESVLEFDVDGRNLKSNIVFSADLGVTNCFPGAAIPIPPYRGYQHITDQYKRIVTMRPGDVAHVRVPRWDIIDPTQCDPANWTLELGEDGKTPPALVMALYHVPVDLTLLNVWLTMEVKG